MPSGSGAKRLLLLAGLGLGVLLIVGLVFGAIGSAIFSDGTGFVSKPEIHLPPQPVFPATVRDCHLGLVTGEENLAMCPEKIALAEVHDAKSAEPGAATGNGEAHATPLGMTQFAVTNTLLSAVPVSAPSSASKTAGSTPLASSMMSSIPAELWNPSIRSGSVAGIPTIAHSGP